ncbi:MAG: carboxylating nicotinate-nucleotide diphosphorylase [Ignavibacteriae bacterium]|nr:carboxylating nicotinate-nucleotide diphosphorylase [Ignavibacteriota bacterium]
MTSEVLVDSRISRLIELALMEDIGLGDLTSEATIPDDQLGKGEFLCKEEGIVAGLEVAGLVFQYCDQSITLSPEREDGSFVSPGQILARLDGKTKGILRGERTALNFLQRMSGIATTTRKYVEAVAGTNAKIVDTRKTAPGLRVLDKWAVRLGGGTNHRFGLDDMILIKENHIAAAGGITEAVERCQRYLEERSITISIEVETRNLSEVREVLTCSGIKRVMLDNFSPDEMRRAVELINHRLEIEASGGITLHNVRTIAVTGVDYISVGALTHSVKALDISLDLSHPGS